MTVPSSNPLGYLGLAERNPPNIAVSTPRNPTSSDFRNVKVGDFWHNTATTNFFILLSVVGPVATWEQFTQGGQGDLNSFTVPLGSSPVFADGAGNIDWPEGNGFSITGGVSSMTGNMTSPFTGNFNFIGALTLGNTATPGAFYTFPLADGSVGEIIITDGAGNLSFASLPPGGVTSVTGTANQILANPTTGDVILSSTDGISLGSFQATAPPVGGLAMPGPIQVGIIDAAFVSAGYFAGQSAATTSLVIWEAEAAATTGSVSFRKSRGTLAAPAATASSDLLGIVGFRGYTSTGIFPANNNASISCIAVGNFTGTSQGTSLDFSVTASASINSNRVLRIESGGIRVGLAGQNSGNILLLGATFGVVTISPQAASGTYNFNLPSTAGTTGFILTSGGGVTAPMLWVNPATSLVQSITGTANQIAASAATGTVILSLTNGLSIGSYAATAPPAGGMILPAALGVGTSSLSSVAIIEAVSTTKGVRFPNMTTTEKNAITGVGGLVVYDATLGKLCVWTTGWEVITSV